MNTSLVSNRVSLVSKRGAAFVVLLVSLLLGPEFITALDLGSSTGRTPYDPYMGPMWSVFGKLGGSQPDPAQVEQWVSEGRAFRYSFSKSPALRSAIAGPDRIQSQWRLQGEKPLAG